MTKPSLFITYDELYFVFSSTKKIKETLVFACFDLFFLLFSFECCPLDLFGSLKNSKTIQSQFYF